MDPVGCAFVILFRCADLIFEKCNSYTQVFHIRCPTCPRRHGLQVISCSFLELQARATAAHESEHFAALDHFVAERAAEYLQRASASR